MIYWVSGGDRMFFKCGEISLKIIGIFHLKWQHRNDRSSIRPFHAISFRVVGNTDMISKDGTTNHFKTGDIAFVPAKHVYQQVAQQEDLYVIHFLSDQITEQSIRKFSSKHPADFERRFSEIYDIWTKKQIGYLYECKSKFYKILYRIEQELNEQITFSANTTMLDIAEYLHDHFTDHSVTIEDLSKRCGMSDTFFRKQFLSAFGTTPLKYINQLRLNYAIELLQSNYFSVEEVAEKCGFNNVYYFSQFMKKQTNNPPSVYRKLRK